MNGGKKRNRCLKHSEHKVLDNPDKFNTNASRIIARNAVVTEIEFVDSQKQRFRANLQIKQNQKRLRAGTAVTDQIAQGFRRSQKIVKQASNQNLTTIREVLRKLPSGGKHAEQFYHGIRKLKIFGLAPLLWSESFTCSTLTACAPPDDSCQ